MGCLVVVTLDLLLAAWMSFFRSQKAEESLLDVLLLAVTGFDLTI